MADLPSPEHPPSPESSPSSSSTPTGKPYEQIQAALDQWRESDDPAQAELAGKRRRRNIAISALLLLGTTTFGLGLAMVTVMQQHEDGIVEYQRQVNIIKQGIETNDVNKQTDLSRRLEDRRTQLSTINKDIEALQATNKQLRNERDRLDQAIRTLGAMSSDDPGSSRAEVLVKQNELADAAHAFDIEEAKLDQLERRKLYLDKDLALLEAAQASVESAAKSAERERADREAQIKDDSRPVILLQADLEDASRGVSLLIEENTELRSRAKSLETECLGSGGDPSTSSSSD